LKKVIINFIESAKAIIKYQYQSNPRIGVHSLASMSPKKKPPRPISLTSINGNV